MTIQLTPLHVLGATFDEDDSVLGGVRLRGDVRLGIVLIDEPLQDLRHQREVGLAEVLGGDDPRIAQSPHHLHEGTHLTERHD